MGEIWPNKKSGCSCNRYVMNESTMIQPCNAYGPMDLATVTKWAIVNGTGLMLFRFDRAYHPANLKCQCCSHFV